MADLLVGFLGNDASWIMDHPDNAIMNELALFSGAGGGILGGKLLGWRTVCAVERDAYAAAVLAQRQNDGCLEPFPIWSDVETFDGKPWCGIVDVVSGGFPCQDVSCASPTKSGLAGERSGLWREIARIIGEVRPRYLFIENSPELAVRGLDRVLIDLAEIGLDAIWDGFSAADVGAPHLRERLFLLSDTAGIGLQKPWKPLRQGAMESFAHFPFTWPPGLAAIADIPRRIDGMAHRMDRLKAIGNGQVPAVARLAWEILTDAMTTP